MINVNDNVILNPENVIIAEQKGSMYKLTLNNGKVLYVNKDVYDDIVAYEPVSKEYVDSKLSGALKRLIVTELPEEDIDINTIYMILDEESSEEGNVYNEYMYISDAWELIGTTKASGPVYSAGTNVSIVDNVISATDTTYTAGTGIEIASGNVINNTKPSGILGDSSAPVYTRACSKVLNKFNTYVPFSTYYNWNDNYQIDGQNVWTDGENIYYDHSDTHLQFDKVNKTWSVKTWTNAPINMTGKSIWTDGENIYYNFSKVLNKSTSTWENKTWTFSPSASIYFNGQDVWTDGTTLYVSNGTDQYYLDKSNNTWKVKTWNGRSSLTGATIWTDGTNIYYYSTYKLNKATSTWESFTFNNTPSNFNCEKLWSDGTDIYHSYGNDSYMLDKKTATWVPVNLGGFTFYYGGVGVWTDGEYLYNSTGSNGRTNSYFRILKNTLRSTKPLMEEYTAGTGINITNGVISASGELYAHYIWHHYGSTHQTWFTIITNSSTPFTFDNLVQWFKDNGLTESSKSVIANGKAPMISGTQNVVFVCSVFVSVAAAPSTLSYTTMDDYNARISSTTITDTVVAL